uniref:Ribosomal protein S6 kinase beta-2 (Trinotate prediction) n=1 Tax=Myxobolus squamalis TaxID=59785 RepID=A0A6B2FW77_MYXSQ
MKNHVMDKDPQYATHERIGIEPLSELETTDISVINPVNKKEIGSKVEDFNLLKTLGMGGQGRVLLVSKIGGVDEKCLYAMKIVRKIKFLRFLKTATAARLERDLLVDIKHQFIVKLFYTFQNKKRLYLVMEFLQGGDFHSFLQRVGTLREFEARFYIAQLTLALEYLHMKNILYRDLKTSNILMSISGDVKLIDFGMSKYLKEKSRTYTLCGTPGHM